MLPYRSESKNQYVEPQAQKGAEEETGEEQRMNPFSSSEQGKQDLDKTHNKDREKIVPNVKNYMEEKLI